MLAAALRPPKNRFFRSGVLAACLLLAPLHALATTTINHQYSPATINPGDVSRYTITIVNSATVPLLGADVTVVFPVQATIATPANVANACGFAGVTATPGDNKVVLSGGTIPARVGVTDGQCTFQVDVTATAPGNWVATIPANTVPNAVTSGYHAFENAVEIFNTTPANATLSVSTLNPPTGAKTFSPSSIRAGDPTTLQIVLTNPNTGATVPLSTFTDNLPLLGGHQMVVASPASPTLNCSGTGAVAGALTATPGATSFTLSGGTLGYNAGGTAACTLTVRVVVPTLTGTSQVFTNSLGAGAIGNTRGLNSPAFSGNLTVQTPIGVAKTFGTSPIASGQPSLMTITLSNLSTTNALAITSFTDAMPAAITVLTTASVPVAAPADPLVNCTGAGAANGTLTAVGGSSSVSLAAATAGPSGACTLSVYVTSTTDGTHTNSIPADAVLNPAGHSSPAASANLVVNAQITISKTATVTSVAPGQWTTFSVTVNNWSGAPVTGVTFVDNLPFNGANQMVLDTSAAPSAGACGGTFYSDLAGTVPSADGDALVVWKGTLPAGVGAAPGVCTLTFRARLPATATNGMNFNNQLPTNTSVSGTGNGPGGPGTPVVNTNSAARNIVAIYSADVAKSFLATSIAQGGTSRLRVTIYNRTLSPLTGVDLTDTLPAGLTLAANPNASTTCSTGTVQAFPGGSQVVFTGGTVAARPAGSQESSCYFQAYVTGTAIGAHVNQIAAGAMATTPGITNGSTVSATLTITTGLTASKSFTPASVTPGGRSRVTVIVSNTSNGQLSNVSVDDNTFGAGLSVANPANAATSCAGAPVVVANPGDARAQLLGATLAAGASCSFSFDVQTGGAGPWTNSIPIGRVTSAEGPSNTAAANATLAVAVASLSINKSFNPVIVTGGMPSRLTIDVVNSSGVAIHNAGFTDTFPAGMQVYPTPNASTNCAGGTVGAVAGQGQVTLSGATLAPSGTCQVYVDVTSVVFLNLSNTIPAQAITSAEGYTNAVGTTASLSTLQGVGLAKAFAPAYIAPGQTSRLRLRLISTYDPNALNPVILNNLTFTDSLPAGVIFATPDNASTDCPGVPSVVNANHGTNMLTLTGAVVSPATNCVIEADVTAGAAGAYNNIIPANTIVTTEGVSNTAPTNAWLYVITAPTLSKAFSAASANVGAPVTLTVTVTNNAAVALSGIALTDTLPAGLAIAGTPNATTNCSNGVATAVAGDNDLVLTGASLAAGASCTFSASVVGNTPGAYTNTLAAGALVTAQGVTNPNSPSAPLAINHPGSVAKSFSPASIAPAGTSTLTLTLGNANAGNITLSAALVDALPGNVVVAAAPNVVKTCPGAVTAAAGATSISYASGALVPPGGCTISVDVTSALAGNYTNTIAAGQLQTNFGNNPQPAIATLGVGGPAAPTLAKAFAPATIDLNGTATLTITLGNPNVAALTLAADFVDALPVNLVLAAPLTLGGTCPAAATGIAGGGTLTYPNGAQIPPGGCTTTALVTSAVAGAYTNTIAAGALLTDGGGNPVPATAGLVVQAPTPPTVLKAFSNNINPGGISRLTITLGNANAAAVTLTALFTDTLPAQVAIANPPNIGGTCPGAVTAIAGGGSVAYANGASIPAGGCTIQADVTSSTSGGPWTNTIPANALQTTAGNNGAPASANLFVNPPAPPSVSKSFSPASIPVGGVSTLSLSFANANAAAMTLSANLVDALPAGVVVAPLPNIQATAGCAAGSVVAVAGAGTVTYLAGGTVPASGGCTIAVNVTSAVPAAAHTNTIGIGALQTNFGSNAVATSAPLQVVALPTVAKAFAPLSIVSGGTSVLTLTLGNSNTTALTLTSALTDALPAGLVVATPNGLGGSCPGAVTAVAGGGSIAYASGAIIPAGGCTIVVNVSAAVQGTYLNTIPACALATAAGCNAAPASATLQAVALPTIGKSFAPASVLVGTPATLTLTLGNANAAAITLTAALTDTLPAGLVVATPNGLGGTCPGAATAVAGGSTVAYANGAAIPPGGCTIVVNVTAPVSGSYVNTIPPAALQTSVGNNVAPASATLQVVVLPTLAKSFAPATIIAGAASTLTLTLGNPNAAPVTLTAALTDTLPAGMVVRPPLVQGGSCPGAVTAVAGGNTVTYASGASIPAGGCTITVQVTANASGSYVNTIPAGALAIAGGSNLAPASATLSVPATPMVAKSFDPLDPRPYTLTTLTITLANPNAGAATLTAELVDTLPAGLTVETTLPASGTCDLAGVVLAAGSVTYQTGRTIPPGNCTIVVSVRVAGPGNYVNTIPAGALATTLGNNPAAASAAVNVDVPSIPTLSELGLVLLALLLVAAGHAPARRVRQRH